MCKSESEGIICPTRGSKRYNGYCKHCFTHLFPADPISVATPNKSKEMQVVSQITSVYDGFIHNRAMYTTLGKIGCCDSKRRMDLWKIIGSTILAVEIDENQHKSYCPQDEEARYNELFMGFSGKYVFVRFNPDSYKDAEGNKQCVALDFRIEALKSEITRQIERIEEGKNEDPVEIIHMFYDYHIQEKWVDYSTLYRKANNRKPRKYKTEEERKVATRLKRREINGEIIRQLTFGRECCRLLEKLQSGEICDMDILVEHFKQLKTEMQTTERKIKLPEYYS